MKKLPINVDCGEELSGFSPNHDKQIIEHCQLINVACGGHAGNLETMNNCVLLAKQNGVLIGAHPSFEDKINFGRLVVDTPLDQLKNQLIDQINSLAKICDTYKVKMHHIKPHGALYNIAATSDAHASTIIEVMKQLNIKEVKLLCQKNSVLANFAIAHGIMVMYESFADRRYTSEGLLENRSIAGSVFQNPQEIMDQYRNLCQGYVVDNTNNKIEIACDTVCLHGDNPHSIQNLKSLQ